MAIDLNVNKYGAQFSAFVDFARKATDENTIVCVSLNAKITASAHFELNPHPAFVNDNNIITT